MRQPPNGCGVTRFFNTVQVGGTIGSPPVASESLICMSIRAWTAALDFSMSHSSLTSWRNGGIQLRVSLNTPSEASTACPNQGITDDNGVLFLTKVFNEVKKWPNEWS